MEKVVYTVRRSIVYGKGDVMSTIAMLSVRLDRIDAEVRRQVADGNLTVTTPLCGEVLRLFELMLNAIFWTPDVLTKLIAETDRMIAEHNIP